MKAIIMAGGFGSRLRPLTDILPKPMMPIINKPIIEYIVELLKSHGIVDIAMTLGYKPEKITEYFGDGARFGVNIRYFIEDTPLGTAGSVKATGDFICDSAVIISGDAFTNIDLSKMIAEHLSTNATMTMAVKYVDDVCSFGVVKYDENKSITAFAEKPKFSLEHMVNTGIYIVEKTVLEFIPEGRYDFSKDLFPRIMPLMKVYEMQEYWSDIGTLSSYYLTNNDVALNAKAFNFAW